MCELLHQQRFRHMFFIVTLFLFGSLHHTSTLFVLNRRLSSFSFVSHRFTSLASQIAFLRLFISHCLLASHVIYSSSLGHCLSPSFFVSHRFKTSLVVSHIFSLSHRVCRFVLKTSLFISYHSFSSSHRLIVVSLYPSMPRIKSNHRFSYRVPLSPKRNAE